MFSLFAREGVFAVPLKSQSRDHVLRKWKILMFGMWKMARQKSEVTIKSLISLILKDWKFFMDLLLVIGDEVMNLARQNQNSSPNLAPLKVRRPETAIRSFRKLGAKVWRRTVLTRSRNDCKSQREKKNGRKTPSFALHRSSPLVLGFTVHRLGLKVCGEGPKVYRGPVGKTRNSIFDRWWRRCPRNWMAREASAEEWDLIF